jgi:phosphodiesterase/alkaline phosphatase D-like protein
MTLTRRDLLRLAGLGAAGLATGPTLVTGCGDNLPFRSPGREHAAIILEPDATSFIVSVWSRTARAVDVEVRGEAGVVFEAIVEVDRTQQAAIDVTDLEPGQLYQVVITSDDGVRMGPHHVQTAPRADDMRPVRIAVSADIDPHQDFVSDLLEHVANASPELFVSLGDFPYADNGPGPAMTVDEYRERHALARTDPRIRRWLETVGIRGIYDDHEFRNDWDASYRESESTRYAAAMQVWDEMFPLRGAIGEVRYRSWRWGAHLECFLLDCRRFRSANAMPDTETKTMLGATQRAWLVDGLRRSTAPFKLVFTSVPLDFGDGDDHWAAFSVERDAILRAVVGIGGVLFVSGDQHVFGAHRHAHGVREMQVGPLSRGVGEPQRTAPGVLFRSARMNCGLVDVDATSLTFSAVGADGERFYKETFSVADLTAVAQ